MWERERKKKYNENFNNTLIDVKSEQESLKLEPVRESFHIFMFSWPWNYSLLLAELTVFAWETKRRNKMFCWYNSDIYFTSYSGYRNIWHGCTTNIFKQGKILINYWESHNPQCFFLFHLLKIVGVLSSLFNHEYPLRSI